MDARKRNVGQDDEAPKEYDFMKEEKKEKKFTLKTGKQLDSDGDDSQDEI